METTTVQLDVVNEEKLPLYVVIGQMTEGFGGQVLGTLVTKEGPSGWPVLQFEGPFAMIQQMLERHGYEDSLATYEVR